MVSSNKNQNARIIVIQKLYSYYINKDSSISYPKHRYKKFIKDVVNGTIERNELIEDEISNYLNDDINLKKIDKVFQIIIKCAIFELLYKPRTSTKIIIKEYLLASNFFIDISQTKYLNALLDKISKKIRNSNG